MLLRINSKPSSLDSIRQTLRNLVLHFIYFFILLFWMRLIVVNAQGNRGVIINNQKFDDSSGGIHQHITSTMSTIQVGFSIYHEFILERKNKCDTNN